MCKDKIKAFLAIVLLISALSSLATAGTCIDDFNDGDLVGWRMLLNFWRARIVVLDKGIWFFVNGAIVGGDDDVEKQYQLYTGDMSWTDYTAEVSVKFSKKLEDCSDSSGAFLGARIQATKGKIGLNCYSVGMWHFVGARRGGFKYIDGFDFIVNTVVIPSEIDRWYRSKINVEKDFIKCFVDDIEVCEFQDETFTSGAVGIAVNGIRATFDDLVVTGPNIPDGGPGHSVNPSRSSVTTWANIKRSACK